MKITPCYVTFFNLPAWVEAKIYLRFRENFFTKIAEIFTYFFLSTFCVKLLYTLECPHYAILCPIPQVAQIIIVSVIFVNFLVEIFANIYAKIRKFSRKRQISHQTYWQLNSNITKHMFFLSSQNAMLCNKNYTACTLHAV
jgi:nitric oxide reductase large subunit